MTHVRKLDISLVEGEYNSPLQGPVRGPRQVFEVFQSIKDRAQETCIGVFLDQHLAAQSYDVLSVGTRRETLMDPVEIFGRAFIFRSRYVILIHNHPSGDPTPSEADRAALRELIAKGKVVDVRLLDFIIVGDGNYWSFAESHEAGDYALGAVA